MRNKLKRLIKWGIARYGRHHWRVLSPQLVILAYHRVLPRDDERYFFEQPVMVVTPETLDQNLLWVSKQFTFISLSSWLEKSKEGTLDNRKYCALTFDDGWIDNLEYALPILEKHSAPATIFCVAGMLNENASNYWPGQVTKLLYEVSRGEKIDSSYIELPALMWLKDATSNELINWKKLVTADYSKVIECLKVYKDLEIIHLVEAAKIELNLCYTHERQVLNKSELSSMVAKEIIEIGSHTIHHIRFDDATASKILEDEIINSKSKLCSELSVNVNTFCYPNGFHPSTSVEIARSHYLGSCTLEKGWNSCRSDFAKLKRVSLHEKVASDKNHFLSLLSGWL